MILTTRFWERMGFAAIGAVTILLIQYLQLPPDTAKTAATPALAPPSTPPGKNPYADLVPPKPPVPPPTTPPRRADSLLSKYDPFPGEEITGLDTRFLGIAGWSYYKHCMERHWEETICKAFERGELPSAEFMRTDSVSDYDGCLAGGRTHTQCDAAMRVKYRRLLDILRDEMWENKKKIDECVKANPGHPFDLRQSRPDGQVTELATVTAGHERKPPLGRPLF